MASPAGGNGKTKFDAPRNIGEIPEEKIVHFLPFHIEYNGPANVESRFTSLINTKNSEALAGEFRGRPLNGKKLDIPNDYEGIIVTNTSPTKKTDDDNENNDKEKTVKVSGKFHEYTYWNWDKPPSGMDDPVKLNDWLEIANELHKPIEIKRN